MCALAGAEQAARRELEDPRAALRRAFQSRKIACEIPSNSRPRQRLESNGSSVTKRLGCSPSRSAFALSRVPTWRRAANV